MHVAFHTARCSSALVTPRDTLLGHLEHRTAGWPSPYGYTSSPRASMASAWGSQKVMSMAR